MRLYKQQSQIASCVFFVCVKYFHWFQWINQFQAFISPQHTLYIINECSYFAHFCVYLQQNTEEKLHSIPLCKSIFQIEFYKIWQRQMSIDNSHFNTHRERTLTVRFKIWLNMFCWVSHFGWVGNLKLLHY